MRHGKAGDDFCPGSFPPEIGQPEVVVDMGVGQEIPSILSPGCGGLVRSTRVTSSRDASCRAIAGVASKRKRWLFSRSISPSELGYGKGQLSAKLPICGVPVSCPAPSTTSSRWQTGSADTGLAASKVTTARVTRLTRSRARGPSRNRHPPAPSHRPADCHRPR